jgi:osmotically-inducible protein OsmY
VTVHDRVVTLSGNVPSYAQKLEVQKAVQRVSGSRGLVLELGIRAPGPDAHGDEAIASALLSALSWTEGVPEGAIRVQVERGCVTLTGAVEWGYQRLAAETIASRTRGVIGVMNQITVKHDADPAEISAQIAAAFKRRAMRGAERVHVDVQHGAVTLRGTVDSLAEKRAAHGIAWSTPGVKSVADELTVA